MYTVKNYKTKKALKEDLKDGVVIRVFQPNNMFGTEVHDGWCCLEGPHYPAPHTWYAEAFIEDRTITKIKSI